jgi:methionyl-tRNA formyltransferase
MRTVFFGSPEAALPSIRGLLDAGHSVELVVTQPDRPAGRGKKLTVSPVKEFAASRGIPLVQPERIRKDPAAVGLLRAARAELFVVVAYGQILPLEIIEIPPHKTINLHFSLLPQYRGAAPVQAALLNGETKTGVTIFRLNEAMDEGDILMSSETDIAPGENAGELESRLAVLGSTLLLETISLIGDIPLKPQDHAAATLAPKLRKEDGLIDWRQDAAAIERRQRLIILKAAPASDLVAGGAPGAVRRVTKRGLEIHAGAGTLFWIERLQPESRGPLDAYAFSLNGRVRAGDILE